MRSMRMPETNADHVIVPSNEKGTGFLRNCYSETVLKNAMSKEEFLSWVDGATKVISLVYSKKRLADTEGISKFKVRLLKLALIAAFLFLILIYLAISRDNLQIEIASYVFLVLSFSLVVSLSFYECLRNADSKFVSFSIMAHRALEEYFSKVN